MTAELKDTKEKLGRLVSEVKEDNRLLSHERQALADKCRELEYAKEQAVERGNRGIYEALERERRTFEVKVKESEDKVTRLVGECRRLEEVKNAVERETIQLRAALERTQSELREAGTTRSFGEMMT